MRPGGLLPQSPHCRNSTAHRVWSCTRGLALFTITCSCCPQNPSLRNHFIHTAKGPNWVKPSHPSLGRAAEAVDPGEGPKAPPAPCPWITNSEDSDYLSFKCWFYFHNWDFLKDLKREYKNNCKSKIRETVKGPSAFQGSVQWPWILLQAHHWQKQGWAGD